jgi:hypothetical protein
MTFLRVDPADSERSAIEALQRCGCPPCTNGRKWQRKGGLVAYGPSIVQIFRQLARLLVKVLRGAKPADMPVEQRTNCELVINLQTAKAIGHEVPARLVLRMTVVDVRFGSRPVLFAGKQPDRDRTKDDPCLLWMRK